MLFLDLKGAFYRVALQFIYRLPTTLGELLDLMNAIHFPDAVLPALQAAMDGALLFDKAVDISSLTQIDRVALAADLDVEKMWLSTVSNGINGLARLELCSTASPSTGLHRELIGPLRAT